MYLRKVLKILERIEFSQFTCDLTPSYWQTQKSVNLPNWTGGCIRHEVRVAIQIKHLMGSLEGPHEYLGAPKDPFFGGVFRGAEVLVG